MENKQILKKTLDVPSELFDKIMAYSHTNKIYKFSPAVIRLLESAFEKLDGENE